MIAPLALPSGKLDPGLDQAGRMIGPHQADAEGAAIDRAAGVHRLEGFQALTGEIHAEVVIGDDSRAGRLGNGEGIADMVAMAMGDDDMADAFGGLGDIALECRIAGEERIDQQGRISEVDAEGGMAEPGKFHR